MRAIDDFYGYLLFLYITYFYNWDARFGKDDGWEGNPKGSSMIRACVGFRKITFAPWLHPT